MLHADLVFLLHEADGTVKVFSCQITVRRCVQIWDMGRMKQIQALKVFSCQLNVRRCVQIWDVGRMKQIRALKGHSARVSALAWSGTTLSSGGRDSNIINHDVRCDKPFVQKAPFQP